MLDAGNIVAFVPISDAEKARAFYEGPLGLRFVKNDGVASVLN
jgi:catechol 2,3-dioxygenase-like lactoylglutathione lyase family enzyme